MLIYQFKYIIYFSKIYARLYVTKRYWHCIMYYILIAIIYLTHCCLTYRLTVKTAVKNLWITQVKYGWLDVLFRASSSLEQNVDPVLWCSDVMMLWCIIDVYTLDVSIWWLCIPPLFKTQPMVSYYLSFHCYELWGIVYTSTSVLAYVFRFSTKARIEKEILNYS